METSDTLNRLALEGEMTIFTAETQKQRLLEATAAGSDLEVDLAHVTDIDLAGLQLMIAIKRQLMSQGHELRFVNHSTQVQEVLDLCDLVGHFGDPVVLFSSSPSGAEAHA